METPRATRADSLRFTALQAVPQMLRGTFTRRPRMSALLDRRHPDPQGIALVSALRERYASDYLWLNMAGKPSLLVLDPEGIRHVLDTSPDVYGPPDLKVKGMSHFQPGAVTISTGDDWTRRRAFNEEVLAADARVHPRADAFLAVVARHTSRLVSGAAPRIRWPGLADAFRRITAGVVFGPAVESEPVLARLDGLMKRANRIAGDADTPELQAFQDAIRARLRDPDAGGLAAAACPHLHDGDPLPVAGQVPHWLFAMKDTLSTNCAYALALIAAHPEMQERVGAEVAATDLGDAESVDRMAYLEGCLRDAMRLWPTTPLLVRKALRDDQVEGHAVPAGSQVIIHNGFNHRNPAAVAEPDAFRPDLWQQGVWDYRFNPMSNGPQACAGRNLVLFLGKAVLGRILDGHRWTLRDPVLNLRRPLPHAFEHQALLLTGAPI